MEERKRALDEATVRHGKNLTLMEYKHRFGDLVSVIEYGKGSIGNDPNIREYVQENMEGVKDLHPGPEPVMPDVPDLFDLSPGSDPFSFETPLNVSSVSVSKEQ